MAKFAIITGGSSGIGRHLVSAFVRDGYDVAFTHLGQSDAAAEVEAAEQELTDASATPRGKLRVSLPQVRVLLMPVLSDFMLAYPDIELDVDFSDRMVDVIEEGFDAVIRTGKPEDSRLMARWFEGGARVD